MTFSFLTRNQVNYTKSLHDGMQIMLYQLDDINYADRMHDSDEIFKLDDSVMIYQLVMLILSSGFRLLIGLCHAYVKYLCFVFFVLKFITASAFFFI